MPTYQYKCPDCGHEFEEFQSIKDDPIEICPSCKGKTRRIISGGAGLIFKGSGFYITDYRSDSYNNAAKSDGVSGASDKSGGSDSKPKDSVAKAATKPAAKDTAAKSKSTPAPTKGHDS